MAADVLSGARRSHGRPPRRKVTADAVALAQMLRAVHDWAVLCFGMA